MRCSIAAICALLAGCGGGEQYGGPVGWWHDAQGGPIAEHRPPPPNETTPYPNLSVVPAAPRPIDSAGHAATMAALAADRSNATYEASTDPLVATAPRDASGLFAPAKPVAASPDAVGAALDAATPAPTTANAPEPAAPVAAKHAAVATPSAADEAALLNAPIPAIPDEATPAPSIPDAPPPPPSIAGVVIPHGPAVPPVTPPPAPPAAPVALGASAAAPLPIAFEPGSAVLDRDGQGSLRALASRRGRFGIEITGFGEADEEDPESQQLGLTLGLNRARAIAAALEGDGVPISALHLAAQAPGRGAAARLVE